MKLTQERSSALRERDAALERAEKAEELVDKSAYDLQGLVNEVEVLRKALEESIHELHYHFGCDDRCEKRLHHETEVKP